MPESPGPSAGSSRPGGRRLEADGSIRISAPGGLTELHRFSHEAMATVFEVLTPHPDRSYAAQAAQAAFDLVGQLERELSRFIPNSDLSRVNRLVAGDTVRVGLAAFECLTIARHLFGLTGGAFDISLGSGLATLDLDEESVAHAGADGVRLDLGAIGKGYAVDRMAEVLEEWDVGPALVHGGFSSILALEPPGGTNGWPLTFSDPRNPARVLERLSVRQTALGASGLLKGDHIRDPRTGEPARERVAAWAALPRPLPSESAADGVPRVAAAAVADAMATAFMVMRLEDVEALCDANPGLEAWILPPGREDDLAGRALVHFGSPQDELDVDRP